MRFIFRADANRDIGTGHVMRLYALAEEAVARKIECVFIGEIEHLPWLTQKISLLGFSNIHKSMQDFEIQVKQDFLFIDSYTIDVNENFLRKYLWKKVVLIADKQTPNYQSDIVIVPSILDSYSELQLGSAVKLLGAKYIPIRKSISKNDLFEIRENQLRIIVSGGGADALGFSHKIGEILDNIDVEMTVFFIGETKIASNYGKNFQTFPIGDSIDLICQNIDLALITSGTLCYEFIAREIPIGLSCAVDNQEQNYLYLSQAGLARGIGRYSRDNGWILDIDEIKDLVGSVETRKSIKSKQNGMIDLKGACRIIDIVLNKA